MGRAQILERRERESADGAEARTLRAADHASRALHHLRVAIDPVEDTLLAEVQADATPVSAGGLVDDRSPIDVFARKIVKPCHVLLLTQGRADPPPIR
jgi:hypothetical protein